MKLIIPPTLFKNFNSIRNLMIRAISYNKSARFRCNRKLVNASTLEKYRRWKTVVTGGYIFFISGKIILVVSVACNFLGNFTRQRRERSWHAAYKSSYRCLYAQRGHCEADRRQVISYFHERVCNCKQGIEIYASRTEQKFPPDI